MEVLVKKILNEKEGKGGWKTLTLKVKPLSKAAKKEFPNNEVNISLAPDNKIKRFENREFELTKPQRFFGSYYPKLTSKERSKSKQSGGNFKNYHSKASKDKVPSGGTKNGSTFTISKPVELKHMASATMQILAAKITAGDKATLKMTNDELTKESLRMAKKLYKSIHG